MLSQYQKKNQQTNKNNKINEGYDFCLIFSRSSSYSKNTQDNEKSNRTFSKTVLIFVKLN